MAELVDALVSGTSVRKDVQVRVLFRAQFSPEADDLKFNMYCLIKCPGGGIGRHTSLRGWRRQKRASSSLVLGTKAAI
jgi:hypothetical protein